MTILKSSFPSHEIDASKNQFYMGIDPLEGIDSMESMHMQKVPVIVYCQIFAETCNILLFQDILIIFVIYIYVYKCK